MLQPPAGTGLRREEAIELIDKVRALQDRLDQTGGRGGGWRKEA